jgi:hypothetical protein
MRSGVAARIGTHPATTLSGTVGASSLSSYGVMMNATPPLFAKASLTTVSRSDIPLIQQLD